MLALPGLAAQEQSRLEVGIPLRSWRNLEGRVCGCLRHPASTILGKIHMLKVATLFHPIIKYYGILWLMLVH